MKRIIFSLLAVLFLLYSCNPSIIDDLSGESTKSVESTESIESEVESSNSEASQNESSESNESNESEAESLPEPEIPVLYIGGVKVTAENAADVFGDGSVSAHYNEELSRYEISLDNASIEASTINTEEPESLEGIYSNKDVYISLAGENEITITIPDIDFFFCFGIRTGYKNTICISGDGSLDVKAEGTGACAMLEGMVAQTIEIENGASLNLLNFNIGNSEYDSFVFYAENIFVRNDSALQVFADGNASDDRYFSLFERVSLLSVESGSELILRGSISVLNRGIFSLIHTQYLYDVYISDDINGKNAKSAEIINGEITVGKNTRYIRITEASDERFSLWVAEKNVTVDNAGDIFGDGTASYNIETQTLTLNNLDISGKRAQTEYGIWASGDLTIILVGENIIECAKDGASTSCAIYCKNLVISGNGSLKAKTAKGNGNYGFSAPIYCKEYTQKGGSVTAIAGNADDYEGYTISCGIYVYEKGITVEKGTLYAESGEAGFSNPFDILHDLSGEKVVYPEGALYEEGTTENGRLFAKITVE
ncbi:MAG: hypothetical protein J6Q72_05415 [Clostridia bacterium]|nr:hypothetical protein [Clostridia bacterium]